MKLNNKGFMMAEVVVVSAIVVLFLGSIYTSYNKMYSAYKTRLTYLDVSSLYQLGYYRNILIENNTLVSTLEEVKKPGNGGVLLIYQLEKKADGSYEKKGNIFDLPESEIGNNINETVYLIYNNKNNLNGTELNNLTNPKPKQTYKDYVAYLAKSVDLTKTTYVMVMERCNTKTNDKNDCKYAYLEIYDGKKM